MDDRKKAMMMMVGCAFLWSSGGLLIKLISWHGLLIAGVRSFFAALVLAAYMRYRKIPFLLNRYSFGAGIGLSCCCLFFVMANKYTTAANAVVLQYSAPVYILILNAVLLKQGLRRKEILAVAGTMVGVILFFFDQLSPGGILGNVMGILAGIGMALMFVMVGLGGKNDAVRMSGICLAHCIASVIGISAGLAVMAAESGGLSAAIAGMTEMEILLAVLLGIFQLGLPYTIYAVASRDCPPLACSLIGMIEPILNPVWVAIFVGEMPGPFALVGGLLIIAVVTWWCIRGEEA